MSIGLKFQFPFFSRSLLIILRHRRRKSTLILDYLESTTFCFRRRAVRAWTVKQACLTDKIESFGSLFRFLDSSSCHDSFKKAKQSSSLEETTHFKHERYSNYWNWTMYHTNDKRCKISLCSCHCDHFCLKCVGVCHILSRTQMRHRKRFSVKILLDRWTNGEYSFNFWKVNFTTLNT